MLSPLQTQVVGEARSSLQPWMIILKAILETMQLHQQHSSQAMQAIQDAMKLQQQQSDHAMQQQQQQQFQQQMKTILEAQKKKQSDSPAFPRFKSFDRGKETWTWFDQHFGV